MMTLMPVAAFAADADDSYVFTTDKNVEVSVGDDVEIQFDFARGESTTNMYVWFVKDGSDVATTNVTDENGNASRVFELKTADYKNGQKAIFKFTLDGTYNVQASFVKPDADNVDDAKEKLGTLTDQKKIVVETSSSSRDYGMIFDNDTLVSKIVGALQDVADSKTETYSDADKNLIDHSKMV